MQMQRLLETVNPVVNMVTSEDFRSQICIKEQKTSWVRFNLL